MDITEIFEAILTITMFVIMRFFVPWLKGRVSETKWDELYKWISISVRAAEMIYSESGMGKEKKNYVRDFLTSKGYTVDDEEINAMLEAAVLELKQEAM